MENWKKILYSKAYLKAEEEFNLKMDAIEKKYNDWFDSRNDPHNSEQSDKLSNYWTLYYSGHDYTFKMDEDLPLEIRKECMEAFESVYK